MSSDGASEKEDFSDWASSLHGANRTKSLFDDSMLDSAQEALEYDARVHNWSLDKVGIQLGRSTLLHLIKNINAWKLIIFLASRSDGLSTYHADQSYQTECENAGHA